MQPFRPFAVRWSRPRKLPALQFSIRLGNAEMSGFYDANEDPEDPLEQELKARPRPQPSTSLLRLLATAQDAVSRLDALASTAPASVRAGLVVPHGMA